MFASDDFPPRLRHPFSYQVSGFTLVELMIVVVIMSLFAGMMMVSVGTSDTRKNMAFYEHLQSNLAYIRLVSMEQMQPYGLAIKLAKGAGNGTTGDSNSNSELVVVKLANAYSHQQSQHLDNSGQNDVSQFSAPSQAQNSAPSWQLDKEIEPLPIPQNVQIDIQPVTASNSVSAPLPWFDPSQAPPVIWFGTGEVTPVKITLQSINSSSQNSSQNHTQIGDTILLNGTGVVELVP